MNVDYYLFQLNALNAIYMGGTPDFDFSMLNPISNSRKYFSKVFKVIYVISIECLLMKMVYNRYDRQCNKIFWNS